MLTATQRAHMVDDLAPPKRLLAGPAALVGWTSVVVLAALLPLALLTMLGADAHWAAPLSLIISALGFIAKATRRVVDRAAIRGGLADLSDAELSSRYLRLCGLRSVAGAPMPAHRDELLEAIREQQRDLLLDTVT